MKQINTYINEKLRLTTKRTYTCQPQNRKELLKIIMDRIKDDGPQCDLNDIDTSKITDMSHLFDTDYYNFKDFNCDISMWNVSNVKDMYGMFYNCKKFNCDISKWNVSNVEDMHTMFYRCENFNCDISKWNISNVKDIRWMFDGCKKFEQDLDSWNVSNVERMKYAYAFRCCPTTPIWYDRKKWEP